MEYLRPRFIESLNEEGNVSVATFEWTRHDVLTGMLNEDAAEEVFRRWVADYKAQCIERCRYLLLETQCLDRFKDLSARVERGSVLPFVGAGMSIPCGFKSWGPFLLSLLADAPHRRLEVELLLDLGLYEEAASLIATTLGTTAFAEEIESKFGGHHTRLDGPVSLLPDLFTGGCLTTNFDLVLPKVYRNAGRPFEAEFAGARLQDGVRRVANEPHCLMRLHGVADERHGRVLTAEEYEAAYSQQGLDYTLERLIGNKSLLFMGCSLTADRTHKALKMIKDRSNGTQIKHFAFLPLPPADERIQRRQFLSEAEIHPIYYPDGDHNESLEALLIALIEGGIND